MKIKSAFERAWQDLKMPSDNIKSQSHRLFAAYQRGASDAHMIDDAHAFELLQCLELVIDDWQAGYSPNESESTYRRAMAAIVEGRKNGG
jgi:hypothetical protein